MRSCLLLSVLFAGCATTPAEDTQDGPVALDPSADPDGDGLTTQQELDGTVIVVDETGLRDFRTERLVVSDPLVADTDGDGLSDAEERANRTDPRRADTDGDGLDDIDELRRWFTSPTSVDTDGDAAGGLQSASTAPLARLFDGAELQLTEIDGVRMAGPNATSPILADTDGDGASDYTEVLSATRRGHVVERPEFSFRPTPGTDVEIALNVVWGENNENSTRLETSFAEENGSSWHVGGSATVAASIWMTQSFSVGGEISAGVDFKNLGVNGGINTSQSFEFGLSTELTGTFTGGYSETTNTTRANAEFEEQVAGQEHTFDGGTLLVSIDITNTGERTFIVETFTLGVSTFNRHTGMVEPLGTLTSPNRTASVGVSAGETVTVLLRNTDLNGDRMKALFENPSSLVFTAANYHIVDAEDLDFDFVLENIYDRSATVVVDWGDGRTRRRHVAAGVGRDASGELIGVSVRDVLADMGIPAASVSHDGELFYTIDDVPTEFYPDEAPPFEGLDAPGYTLTGGPQPGNIKASWFLFVDQRDRNPVPIEGDLLDLPLFPGDQLTIAYSEDLDRDGIPAVEERMRGTSDTSRDSDARFGQADNLSDFWEAYEGWSITINNNQTVFVTSSPGRVDTDGDGLTDDQELALLTHPERHDTDFDGMGDFFEAPGNHPNVPQDISPVVFDLVSPPQIECPIVGVRQCSYAYYQLDMTAPNTFWWNVYDRRYTTDQMDIIVRDAGADVEEVTWTISGYGWPGSQTRVDSNVPPTVAWEWSDYHRMTPWSPAYIGQCNLFHTRTWVQGVSPLTDPWGYIEHHTNEVHITARDSEGNTAERTCTFGDAHSEGEIGGCLSVATCP